MSPLNWYKKEIPVQGLTGLWGGVGSNLVAGGGPPPGQQLFSTVGSTTWSVPAGVKSISAVAVGGGGGGYGNQAGGGGVGLGGEGGQGLNGGGAG